MDMVKNLIGEVILFVVGIPLFLFQTFEILHALIEFIAEYVQYQQK